MAPFQQIGDSDRPPLVDWSPALACLGAGVLVAILVAPQLYGLRLSIVSAPVHAATSVAGIFTAALLAGLFARRFFRPDPFANTRPVLVRFAEAGVWFVPPLLLVAQGLWWSVAPIGVLAFCAARLLRRFQRLLGGGEATEPSPRCVPFIAILLLQPGVALAFAGAAGAAACLTSAGCGLVGWAAGSDLRSLEPGLGSRYRVGVAVRLALTLLATSILMLVNGKLGIDQGGVTGAMAEQQGTSSAPDRHSGVILVPESQPHVKLIAPGSHSAWESSIAFLSRPINIPFSGEYWFFYWPQRRPPADSLVTRGTPLSYNFTAPARTHLSMQARQTLSQSFSTLCCGGIDLSLTSADPFPRTVSVEMILADTAHGDQPAVSLGEINLHVGTETVHFNLPSRMPIPEFNQIHIVFHLQDSRAHRSGNIAIDGFRLTPRRS